MSAVKKEKRGKKRDTQALVVVPDPARVAEPEGEEAWWTEKRRALLDLLFSGMSKTRAAAAVGIHKETAIAWSKHPFFKTKLGEKIGDHIVETKIRRTQQTTHFGDKAAAFLKRNMTTLEKRPDDADARAGVRLWSDEFRRWRDEERKEFGENVTRSQVFVGGNVDVGVHVGSKEISLRSFISSKAEAGAIDVEALPEGADVGTLIASALAGALASSPEISDLLNEEDKAEAGKD